MWKLLSKGWPYLLLGVVLFLLGSWLYHSGSVNGANAVQVKWDAEKKAYAAEIEKLKTGYAALESEHRAETTRITHELAEADKKYEVAIANAKSDYANRLRNSEDRAAVYKRQAQSGAAESQRLASHAAELDRSLEEGRSLVRELRTTLGLRDEQLKALGEQILNDRKLLNSDGTYD